MKGKLTCYLCLQPIADHERGQLCWLQALATGAVHPLVVGSSSVVAVENLIPLSRLASAN
jgi:hypothetical protein